MTHCAKCGAELIGTKKFCTACGTPAGDPRSPAASTGMSPAAQGTAPSSAPGSPGPSIQYAPAPVSQVNPFAQTTGPGQSPPASTYGPPPSAPMDLASTAPGVGDPSRSPQVSPLATSNVDSNRGGFLDAIVAAARAPSGGAIQAAQPSGADPSSSVRYGVPGTQLMPSMANPSVGPGAAPSGAPSAAGHASEPGQKRQGRTQVLGVFPGVPPRPSAPGPSSVVAPSMRDSSKPEVSPYGPTPQAAPPPPIAAPPPVAAPAPPPPPPASAPPPPAAAPPPRPQQPPPPVAHHMGPGVPLPSPGWTPQQGWNPAPYPAAPPPPPAYGFGYAPGSRVTVTWSNGQRYPGTVTQTTGNQCLVVFPDGQHHWVEMQYVAPA